MNIIVKSIPTNSSLVTYYQTKCIPLIFINLKMDLITANNIRIVYTLIFFWLAKHNSCSPSSFHSKNTDIDDFINKLMTSEKFNDLADLIAEKAARKIQHSNKYKPTKIANKTNDVSNETEHIENTAEDTSSRSEEKRVFKNAYRVQEAKHRNDYAKLNPQTFIQVDAALPSEELLLKYKYLTKGGHSIINKDTQKTDIYKGAYHKVTDNPSKIIEEKITSQHLQSTITDFNKNNKKYNQKFHMHKNNTNKFSNMAASSEYINLNTEEEKNTETEEIRDEEKLKAIFQSEEKIDSGQGEKHVHEESDNEREHDEIKTHYSQLIDKSEPETIHQNKVGLKETYVENFVTKTSSEVNKSNLIYAGNKHYNTTNFEKLKENVEYEDIFSGNNEYKENRPKRLRKEGGKVFTFESSPDYNEYHEKAQDTQISIDEFTI